MYVVAARTPWLYPLLALCFTSWLLATAPARAETIYGKVVSVADGDTLGVLVDNQQYKIRLTEIDTPERGQPFGKRAREALSAKVFQQQVSVRVEGRDRYGRLLGRVFLGQRDINRELLAEGYAWAYRQYLSDDSLLATETQARNAGLGLWRDAAPIAPWDWRRGARQANQQVAALPATPQLCGTKQYCRQMTSCAEASFYLQQCAVSSLDGDGDGIPCEALCRSAGKLPSR
jgi:endonuclease YncB( thermonuclease family)